MDTKHRTAYARVKITGVAEPIVLNEGKSLMMLLIEIQQQLRNAKPVYQAIDIRIEFTPMSEHLTSQEIGYREVFAGLDMALIQFDDDTDTNLWDTHPRNPESPNYDPLFDEYLRCKVASHRATKTPEDLGQLRRHMDTNYKDSQWWDRSHTF